MWELEERHLQEKHQLFKQQLKDQYFMQRHQLLKRHEKVCSIPASSTVEVLFLTHCGSSLLESQHQHLSHKPNVFQSTALQHFFLKNRKTTQFSIIFNK